MKCYRGIKDTKLIILPYHNLYLIDLVLFYVVSTNPLKLFL